MPDVEEPVIEVVLAFCLVADVAVAEASARLPSKRDIYVGVNCTARAIEMEEYPERGFPFFFLKPADVVVNNDRIWASEDVASIR